MTEQGAALVSNVSSELKKMFEQIAKLAIQGASEAEDPDVNIMDKARHAHSRIALIMDDAMKGLANANHAMFVGAMFVAGEDDSESGV